jgi:hypothetical protein
VQHVRYRPVLVLAVRVRDDDEPPCGAHVNTSVYSVPIGRVVVCMMWV